jgi:riboflavin kinase / FMN adenylyltransferase
VKIIRGNKLIKIATQSVVTVGVFDGVHCGHALLLSELKKTAFENNFSWGIVTFHPHPGMIVGSKERNFKLLCSLEERIEKLSAFDPDFIWVMDFDSEMVSLSAKDFISGYLIPMFGVKKMILGHDNQFGRTKNRDEDELISYCNTQQIDLLRTQALVLDEKIISSTVIRRSLETGNVKEAKRYLGYPYTLKGEVVGGNRIGNKIGFPTANLSEDDSQKLIPPTGVYAVRASTPYGIFGGMLNIGIRPTLNINQFSIETHLFNFNDDLYGQQIEIEFIARIRNEQKFQNVNELIAQLYRDKEKAIQILEHDRD